MPVRVLVTNDDGPFSPGLRLLYRAVKPLADEVTVIVPETPKSASGLGLTLHKPLRVNEIIIDDMRVLIINGTPSDVVYATLSLYGGSLDLVVSGVNLGDNTSVQVALASGTIGAALQAALAGVPAVAFSYAGTDPADMEREDVVDMVVSFSRKVSGWVLRNGMPPGVDVISVNFPREPTKEAEVVPLAMRRFTNLLVKREDPRGVPYYWLYGQPVDPEPGTDVYTLLVEGKITITPLSLRGLTAPLEELRGLIDELKEDRE